MGLFSKLKFWKKDDLDFDALAEKELGGTLSAPSGFDKSLGQEKDLLSPEESPFTGLGSASRHPDLRLRPEAAGNENLQKDLELISSKLDTLKVLLTSLDQRISNLERSAGVEQGRQRLW